MGYVKPILSEIYSEIRFTIGSLTDLDFFDIVPALKNIGYSVTELQQHAGALIEIAQNQPNIITSFKVRCWTEDKKELVQIAADRVIFNQIGDYLGWGIFTAQLHQVLDAIQQVKALEPTSVSLSTIDKIDADLEGYRFGEYLDCKGLKLPAWYEDSSEAADIVYGRGRLEEDGFNRQLNFAVRVKEDKILIQITSTFTNDLNDAGELFSVLEDLHVESTQSFESIITDRVREMMGSK